MMAPSENAAAGVLVKGTDAEIHERLGRLWQRAMSNDERTGGAEAIERSREFRMLEVELLLRGLPGHADLMHGSHPSYRELVDDSYDWEDGPALYEMELARRDWLCSIKAGCQYELVGDWRAVVGPSDSRAELCVPGRVIIFGEHSEDRGYVTGPYVVRETLAGLLAFAAELKELGADVKALLGVSVAKIRQAHADAVRAYEKSNTEELP